MYVYFPSLHQRIEPCSVNISHFNRLLEDLDYLSLILMLYVLRYLSHTLLVQSLSHDTKFESFFGVFT